MPRSQAAQQLTLQVLVRNTLFPFSRVADLQSYYYYFFFLVDCFVSLFAGFYVCVSFSLSVYIFTPF